MTNKLLYCILLGLFVCSLLVACDDGVAPPPPQASAKNKPAVKQTAVAPEVSDEPQVAEYVYDPTGTRDPFKNPFGTLTELPIDNAIPLTPLQKVSLDQLRVIGVIIGKGEPKAMVIAPDNKSFVLKKGTKIGRNNGAVASITTDSIIIEEQYLDFTGEVKTKMQEIMLPKQGGVK